jgi:sugar lactone lactonase YvrE
MPPLRQGKLLAAALLAGSAFSGAAVAQAPGQPGLNKVASFQHQVTGVNVNGDGRIFLNFPRWTEDSEISVGELKDGKVVPYPDAEWNAWRNAEKDKIEAKTHFVCVQSIVIDHSGHLWVLDPAAPAMAALVPGGAKIVKIDLATNKVVQTIFFDDKVAPQGSYLNDIRFSPDDKVAYITDSGAKGALVVVDLTTGTSRRVLDGDPSTQADKSVTVTLNGQPLRRPDGRGVDFTADGIALSPDGKTLYWQAIKGKTLYSLPTSALNPGIATAITPEALSDSSLRGKIQEVGENGPADGLMISRHDGKMYVTGPETNSIGVRDLSKSGGKPTMVLQDEKLHWPDTFSEGADGTIYFTTSHIQDSAFYKQGAPIALPTELWSFKPTK